MKQRTLLATLLLALLSAIAPAQISGGGMICQGSMFYGESAASKAKVVKVAGKQDINIALRADGTVATWGSSGNGGTSVAHPVGTAGYINVEAGYYFVMAQKADGTLTAWGGGSAVQLPNNLGAVTSFAGGLGHGLAAKTNGTVQAWGGNSSGQTTVPGGLSGVIQVAAGANHSVALKNDGTVVAWGLNTSGQTSVPAGLSDVVQIDAASDYTVALKSDGTVLAWGTSADGQTSVPAGLTEVVKISAGRSHAAALKNDGTVVTWGGNNYLQRNLSAGLQNIVDVEATFYATYVLQTDGTLIVQSSVGYAKAPSLNNLISITAGAQYVFGLRADGTLQQWAGSQILANIPASAIDVVQISAGSLHMVALKSNGTVVNWGNIGSPYLIVPAALSDVTQVAAGYNHSLALKSDGTVVAWGSNSSGQCSVPAGLTDVVQIGAGVVHSTALKSDGTVICWGDMSSAAAQVPAGLSDVVAISVYRDHNIALKSNGTVVVWGGVISSESDIVNRVTNAVAVGAGWGHYVALKADGTLVKSGNSGGGQNYNLAGASGIVKVAGGDSGTYMLPAVTLEISGSEFAASGTLTGTVCLPYAPGPGGATIALTSDRGSVMVPSSVFVSEGSHTATFNISGAETTEKKVALIRATYLGVNAYGAVTLTSSPNYLTSLTLSQNTVVGGSTDAVTGTVHTAGVVTHDVVVQLQSDGWMVGVPNNVTVPAGSSSASFALSHIGAGQAKITATDPLASVSANLDVQPLIVESFTLSKSTVIGGASLTATVTLNAPTAIDRNVRIVSYDTDHVVASEFVTILAGTTSRSFTIETNPVAQDAGVILFASFNGEQKELTLNLTRLAIDTVVLNPSSVTGGSISTGTVTLNAVAPKAVVVTLSSDNAQANVNSTVTIAANSQYATFTINTDPVAADTTAQISASVLAAPAVKADLAIAAPTVQSLTLPVTKFGAQRGQGSIVLTGPAPAGLTIALSADKVGLNFPSSVTFNQGYLVAEFTYETLDVAKQVTVTLSTGGKAAAILIKPLLIKNIVLSPNQVIGGSPKVVTATVTLVGAPANDVEVSLATKSTYGSTSVPATLTIGNTGIGTFTVDHKATGDWDSALVIGTRLAVSRAASLAVGPNPIVSVTATASVIGGSTAIASGTVTLKIAVGHDTTINLSSNNMAAATVPAIVTISAGAKSATFPILHKDVAIAQAATISASLPGSTMSAAMTVRPNPLKTHTVSPSSVVGGDGTVVTGTITLTAPVANDTVVTLSVIASSGLTIPTQLTIPAGQSSATYTVAHNAVVATKTVNLKATRNGLTKAAPLTLIP